MESRKLFVVAQRTFIVIAVLVGSLNLGLMAIGKTNASQTSDKETENSKAMIAETGVSQRMMAFKQILIASWKQEAKSKGLLPITPPQFRGATLKEAKLAKSDKKVIALTFDDGPVPNYTEKILDILKKNNVKATFFIVGANLKLYPAIGKRIVGEGHTIANHTWHHWYHPMNPQVAASEIDNTSNLIFKTTGVKTNLFRPPGGIMNNGVAVYARNKKYVTLMWSVDSIDFKQPPAEVLANRVVRGATHGGIALMHDGGGKRPRTVEALPKIISRLRAKGYSFVTIPELLEMQDKQEKEEKLATQKKQ